MPAPKNPARSDDAPATGKYLVLAVGAPYTVDNTPGKIVVGLQGRVVDLTDDEATRLLNLNAVRAATEDEVKADEARKQREADIEAQNTAGPAGNPFGGRTVAGVSLEDHAAEQIALARKAGRL